MTCEIPLALYDAAMHEVARALPPRFDASDPAVRVNPYPVYARLRAAAPVCRGGPGQWVISRYTEVAALLNDRRLRNHFPERYYDFTVGSGPAGEFLQNIVLHQDEAKHKSFRRAMAHDFEARTMRNLRDRIARLADAMIVPALDTGFLEVVHDLARPLPTAFICEIIGIPLCDRREISSKTCAVGKAFAPRLSNEDRLAADKAIVYLREYIRDLLQHARGDDGFLSRFESCGSREAWTKAETLDNIIFLFFAGFETTTSLISTACVALVNSPEQLARVRCDSCLIPRAIEEFLRYDAPIQSRLRLVQEPVEIAGRLLKPGRLALLLLGSANHDERQFARPEELDVTRHPNPHLSFGAGEHHCLGATLARLECAIVLERLFFHFKRMEPAGSPVRDTDSPFRTYDRIPVTLGRTGS